VAAEGRGLEKRRGYTEKTLRLGVGQGAFEHARQRKATLKKKELPERKDLYLSRQKEFLAKKKKKKSIKTKRCGPGIAGPKGLRGMRQTRGGGGKPGGRCCYLVRGVV